VTAVTAQKGVQRFALEGETVAFLEESHAIPLVSIVIAFRMGSGEDPAGKEGLARLAMRMLRRGTDKKSAKQIEESIDTLGGEMAVDTSVSSVAVHAQVIGRNVEPFVDLLAHLLSSSTFPEDEFSRLRRESIAEIVEARDNDRAIAQKAFQRFVFPGHA
jgi:zinc protease